MAETTPRPRPGGHRAARTCVECGGKDVIEIEMTLHDGTEVLFCSCHSCENRWWNHDGEQLGLDAVLRLARPEGG